MSTLLKLLLPLLITAIQAATGADGMRLRTCHGSLGFSGEHSHECESHGLPTDESDGQLGCEDEQQRPGTPSGPAVTEPSADCVLFVVPGSRCDVRSMAASLIALPAAWMAQAAAPDPGPCAALRPVQSMRGPPNGALRSPAERAGALPLRL